MKFICEQPDLNNALTTVGRGVPTRTPLPITTGIKVTAQNGKVKLTSTNQEIMIEKLIDANVEVAGETVIPGSLFIEIVKKLPAEPISFTLEENKVELKTANSQFHLMTFDPNEFPKIEEDANAVPAVINKDSFIDMINGTAFAASIDESKGALTGIKVEIENGKMTMIAIDGFRMAVRTEDVNMVDSLQFVVPATTMDEIRRIKSDSDEISVALGKNVSSFRSGDTKIITRLFETDTYNINWKGLIPNECNTEILVKTDALTESVVRASLFADGKNSLIKFNIGDYLEITSRSEVGNVRETLPMAKNGDDVKIGFNSRYLLEALRVIDDEDVRMEFSSSIKPVLLKPENGSNSYLYMVLPVRLPVE